MTHPALQSAVPCSGTRSRCLFALIVLGATAAGAVSAAEGSWTTTGSHLTPRWGGASVPLADGKALTIGGSDSGGNPLSTAELYDPATGTWAATNPLNGVRHAATATVLPDGRVLVVGGLAGFSMNTAEIYDPGTQGWTTTNPMASARYAHSATLLQDGRVLVAGGYQNSAGIGIAGVEIFDPGTNTWTPTASLTVPRYQHSGTLLPNGKVLVVGGSDAGTAEIYDPATGTWTPTTPPLQGRNVSTAVLLDTGKVLLAGGAGSIASAELYDPATATWTATGSMAQGRYAHASTKLASGKVLVTGGFNANGPPYEIGTAEVYDPATGQWNDAGSVIARYNLNYSAALLQNGTVVVSGGSGSSTTFAATQVYTPPLSYPFKGFFQPVDNLPTVNSVKAGSGIPIKFSLGGDRGMNILSAGFPQSQTTSCSAATFDSVEETVTAGGSDLQYDPATQNYTYVWKTMKEWANTCREFTLKLADGSIHKAVFFFQK